MTHNRDEKVARPTAIPPQKYVVNKKNVYYPKDPQAGGTWYAVSESGVVVVLLNGAEEKHEPKSSYLRSRGLIVLDLISSNSSFEAWNSIDLMGIEPFTIVLYQEQKLYQLRWDEVHKTTLQLDLNQSYIWSSTTLYSKEIREYRRSFFQEFLLSREITADTILAFHKYTNSDDQENGLIINRNNEMRTLSITQTVIQGNNVLLSYHDLQNQQNFINSITTQ